MSDDSQKPKKRSLSEISHLFLSSVRDRHTNGTQRPQRTAPKRSDMTIDLTPEEFAQAYGTTDPAAEPQRRSVPITAVIGAHLNGKEFDRVKEYARHRAGVIGRVGLIEMDASELRLMSFDMAAPTAPAETETQTECAEPRQMAEALEEMNWDVEQWLLLLPNPRTPEAKALLREIDHWVLLSTADHDGVVSSYRMLKGLAESARPQLTLAVLDAEDDADAGRVYQKLSGVCQQFLQWTLEAEPPVQPTDSVSEHLVLLYRPTRDKAQLAISPQWAAVSEFVAAAKAAQQDTTEAQAMLTETPDETVIESESRQLVADVVIPTAAAKPIAVVPPAPMPQAIAPAPATVASLPNAIDDVIDLPGDDASGQSILVAVLRRAGNTLIECPLRPPMCVEARLAVGRDRGLVLLIAASQGLGDLRIISQAYRWLSENRELIGMALPQFAIDSKQMPRLQLLVDRADLSADALHPMLQSEHVTLQAYRKLRWGQKLGVCLEAA
jgi:hypothetical protein